MFIGNLDYVLSDVIWRPEGHTSQHFGYRQTQTLVRTFSNDKKDSSLPTQLIMFLNFGAKY